MKMKCEGDGKVVIHNKVRYLGKGKLGRMR